VAVIPYELLTQTVAKVRPTHCGHAIFALSVA
jgi:hypothetical protein